MRDVRRVKWDATASDDTADDISAWRDRMISKAREPIIFTDTPAVEWAAFQPSGGWSSPDVFRKRLPEGEKTKVSQNQNQFCFFFNFNFNFNFNFV